MEVKYAGFWVRVAASIVDSIWQVILAYGPIIVIAIFDLMDVDGKLYLFSYIFVQFILPAIVTILFWYFYQATPGKMLVNIKIVDAVTLGRPNILQYCLRYIGYYLSIIVLLLGYFMVGFTKRKRGLHDYMARTVVVHTR